MWWCGVMVLQVCSKSWVAVSMSGVLRLRHWNARWQNTVFFWQACNSELEVRAEQIPVAQSHFWYQDVTRCTYSECDGGWELDWEGVVVLCFVCFSICRHVLCVEKKEDVKVRCEGAKWWSSRFEVNCKSKMVYMSGLVLFHSFLLQRQPVSQSAFYMTHPITSFFQHATLDVKH